MAGRLAVSVIEARDVDGDTAASEQLYYVRLRLDTLVHKTAPATGSCPRFLKDVLFEVKEPQKEALMVELCQVGPHGDLVVGSCQVQLWGLTGVGTSVQWLTLNSAAAALGGRLCVVFRYAANPAATRSTSPQRVSTPPLSSSIRAPSPQASTPGPAAGAAAAAAAEATSTSGPTTPPTMETNPKVEVLTPATPTRQQQAAQQQQQRSPSPQQRTARAGSPAALVVPASSLPDESTCLSPRLTSTKSSRQRAASQAAAGPSKPPSATSSKRSSGSSKHKSAAVAAAAAGNGIKLKALAQKLPVPLAMTGGLLLGALGFLWHQRDILYEVQESDLVCTMGACVLRGATSGSGASLSSRRQGRVEVIPEAVIPGDRLRLK